MTFLDVLKDPTVRNGEKWFRPDGWKKSGIAVVLIGQTFRCVPSDRGGFPWHPTLNDIESSWEVFSPEEILDERY